MTKCQTLSSQSLHIERGIVDVAAMLNDCYSNDQAWVQNARGVCKNGRYARHWQHHRVLLNPNSRESRDNVVRGNIMRRLILIFFSSNNADRVLTECQCTLTIEYENRLFALTLVCCNTGRKRKYCLELDADWLSGMTVQLSIVLGQKKAARPYLTNQ